MPTLIYIHGFLSSPHSAKAKATQSWLQNHRSDWQFACPSLSSYPGQTRAALDHLVGDLEGDHTYLIGSSLGGFWATYLTEAYGFKSVLVNPAVHPHERFRSLAGQTLTHYHTGEVCILGQDDVDYLAICEPSALVKPALYWLMAQTGDQTLDYRDAVERYQGCRQTVEAGGDHSFVGFENWLPEIIEFFESPNSDLNKS